MTKPLMLDLFCKAGGAGVGYSQAYGKNVAVAMDALAPYMSGPKPARYVELLAKAQQQKGGERTL